MNGAAQALDQGGADGSGGAGPQDADGDQDQSQDQESGTFFLPPDFLGGKKYKAGDTIELTVVGEDEDGDTEVKLAGAGEGDDWRSDLKSTLASAGEQSAGQQGA